ncbi:MAG: amidohydrolase family protein [Gemmatimonadetes bacterium]|nr:amidohydrolase family protein [Gemmatimonadota bacterium]
MRTNQVLRSISPIWIAMAGLAASSCATAPVVTVAAGVPVDGNSFVVRNVRVFDGHRAIEGVDVVVKAGRIDMVGHATPQPSLPVVDGAGAALIPGLIEAHGHVEAQRELRDALRFGVTTELDMLSRIDFTASQKSRRTQMERTDLADLWTAGSPVTSPRGLGTQFGIPFSTISKPDEAVALVSARIAEGSDYIKVMYEPGAPLFTTISYETMAAVVAAAHARGVLVVAHISSVEGARGAVRAGVDELAHVFSDTLVDDAFAREIAAHRTFVCATLSIFGGFQGKNFGAALVADARLSPYLSAAQRAELIKVGPGPKHPMAPYLVRFDVDRAIENVRRLRAAGVRILAGTDAANLTSHGVSVHGEMELLTRAGLTPAEALEAATLAPAEAFHLDDRGRIAAGARADLLLVNGNPLVDITATRAIIRIFKNGFEVSRAIPAVIAAPVK